MKIAELKQQCAKPDVVEVILHYIVLSLATLPSSIWSMSQYLGVRVVVMVKQHFMCSCVSIVLTMEV